MALHLADVDNEYIKDNNLKKDDVQALVEWIKKQPHLPDINELQAVLFLQSCYYRNEAAKKAIDTYFTMKTLYPDILRNKNPISPLFHKTIENSLATCLPKKTPEGYTIIFLKLVNPDPEHFNFIEHIKLLDMACMLQLYQEGTSAGHLIVADLKGALFGHLTKVAIAGPMLQKKFLHYLQEGMPIRLKRLHFVNIVPFMDKILAMIKPFMKIELLDVLYLHNTVDELTQFIPLECLPKDYGGSVEETSVLHEKAKEKYLANSTFFEWEDKQTTDESKRVNKLESVDNIFGVDGTFKKLSID